MDLLLFLAESSDHNKLIPRVIKLLHGNIDMSTIDLNRISIIMHKLYTKSSKTIRYEVLNFCLALESNSTKLLCCEYHFDKLISFSLSREISDDQIDNERIIAFSYTLYIARRYNKVPLSIIRALIALWRMKCLSIMDYFIVFFSELLLYDESIGCVTEITHILYSTIMTENCNKLTLSVIIYSIENRLPLISHKDLNNYLLTSLVYVKEIDSPKKYSNGLIYLLSTWSGFIFLGIHCKMLEEIINVLPYSPEPVSFLLLSLVKGASNKDSCLKYFVGFVINVYHKYSVFDFLVKISHTSESARKLLDIYHSITNKNHFSRSKSISDDPFLNRFTYNNTTITQEMYQGKPSDWKWNQIYYLFLNIFPYSQARDCNQSLVTDLCNKMILYYSEEFINSEECYSFSRKIFLPFLKFIFMMEYQDRLLLHSESFKRVLIKSCNLILEKNNIPLNSNIWTILQGMFYLISFEKGISLLEKYDIIHLIEKMECSITNALYIKNIIKFIIFDTDSGFSVSAYYHLFNNSTEESHKYVLEDLNTRFCNNDIFFADKIYDKIVIRSLLNFYLRKEESKFTRTFIFLHKILRLSETCLKYTTKNNELCECIKKTSRFIYSYLFSIPEFLDSTDLDEEILWWISKGNVNYIRILEFSLELSVNNVSQENVNNIDILYEDDQCVNPPHLFSFVTKHEKGITKIEKHIPAILAGLDSDDITKKRASVMSLGYLCSNKLSDNILRKYEIHKKIIQSFDGKSFALLGTIITSLSMISADIDQFYSDNKFVRSIYEGVVSPEDVKSMILDIPEKRSDEYMELPDDPVIKSGIEKISQLTNPLLTKDTQTYLQLNLDIFKNIDLVKVIHEYLGNYCIPPNIRHIIYNFISGVPLLCSDSVVVDNIIAKKSEVILNYLESGETNQSFDLNKMWNEVNI